MHLLVLAAPQRPAVHIGAHLDGDLELQAAVAKEGEEQPRVVGREGAGVVGLPAEDATVLQGWLVGQLEGVEGHGLKRVGNEELVPQSELHGDGAIVRGVVGVVVRIRVGGPGGSRAAVGVGVGVDVVESHGSETQVRGLAKHVEELG